MEKRWRIDRSLLPHLALACAMCAAGAAGAEIVIAAVGPLSVTPMTGQYAMFGEAISRG